MVEKTFLGTDSEDLLIPLKSVFKNSDLIEILEISKTDFWRFPKFDIVQMPTTLAEQFGSKPFDLDCQILTTKQKYGLPEFIVTNPNFTYHLKMNYHSKGIYQIEIPLKKVIDFAKGYKKNLRYGYGRNLHFLILKKIKLILKK